MEMFISCYAAEDILDIARGQTPEPLRLCCVGVASGDRDWWSLLHACQAAITGNGQKPSVFGSSPSGSGAIRISAQRALIGPPAHLGGMPAQRTAPTYRASENSRCTLLSYTAAASGLSETVTALLFLTSKDFHVAVEARRTTGEVFT